MSDIAAKPGGMGCAIGTRAMISHVIACFAHAALILSVVTGNVHDCGSGAQLEPQAVCT